MACDLNGNQTFPSPLFINHQSSGTTTKHLRVEEVWVPLPIHGDESDPGNATEIVDESGNACNVNISEVDNCFDVDVDNENIKTILVGCLCCYQCPFCQS